MTREGLKHMVYETLWQYVGGPITDDIVSMMCDSAMGVLRHAYTEGRLRTEPADVRISYNTAGRAIVYVGEQTVDRWIDDNWIVFARDVVGICTDVKIR